MVLSLFQFCFFYVFIVFFMFFIVYPHPVVFPKYIWSVQISPYVIQSFVRSAKYLFSHNKLFAEPVVFGPFLVYSALGCNEHQPQPNGFMYMSWHQPCLLTSLQQEFSLYTPTLKLYICLCILTRQATKLQYSRANLQKVRHPQEIICQLISQIAGHQSRVA